MIFAFGNPVYDHITTPVLATQGRVLSGCSTNACLALTRLGHQTTLVGRIGPEYQQRFSDDLARYGIAAYTQLCEQTGGFRLNYDQRGDRTLDVLGVAAPIDQVPAACAAATAVIIGPILQETPLPLISQVHQLSRAEIFLDPQGLLRRFDADGRVEHYLPTNIAQVAQLCHTIKANEVEAQIMTGIDPRHDPAAAARAILNLGCKLAIVTLAEAGSFIDSGKHQLAIPAYPTEARDPTGAGDTYLAGFMHAYLDDPADLYRAGCFGSATSSIWIEHTGPDAPIEREEVTRRAATLLHKRPQQRFT